MDYMQRQKNAKKREKWAKALLEDRQCRRNTKKGERCKNRVEWLGVGICNIHIDEAGLRLQEVVKQAYERGYNSGKRIADPLEQTVTITQPKPEAHKNFRTHDIEGRQIVLVDGLSYFWAGKIPLKVGDKVQLPRPYWMQGTDMANPTGTVSQLGSSYVGDLRGVVRLLTPTDASV